MPRMIRYGLLVFCLALLVAPSLAGAGLSGGDPVHASLGPARDFGPPAETMIVNGRATGSQPSTGALLLGQDPDSAGVACSGVLIGCDSFLTSAQCVCPAYPCDPGQIDTTQYLVFLQNAGFFTVSEVRVPPDWAVPGPDIAVLKLGSPVNGVPPAKINTMQPVPPRSHATISGFGLGDDGFGGIKREGTVQTSECQYGPSDYDSICWWFEYPLDDPGSDSNWCYGDEGGPMFVDMGDGPVVAGTHSGGFSADCSPPDVSWDTNLYTYKDFILAQVPDHGVASCGDLPQVGSAEVATADFAADLDGTTTSRTHSFLVPPDVAVLRVTMNSDSFSDPSLLNLDLYLNYGVPPADGVEVACRREGLGNYASCEIQNPQPGTWYAKVNTASNLFSEQYNIPAPYQVTASSFRTVTYAGVTEVTLTPRASASWPGGVVPHTLQLRNMTDEQQRPRLTAWAIPPSGPKYAVRKAIVPLEAGEVREIPIPVPVPSTAELGEWMVVVESNVSGLIDKGWNSFEVQLDRAADIELTSPTLQIFEGESWNYTSTIKNVSGLQKVAEVEWRLVDPQGTESAWETSVPLAPGQTWTQPGTLDALNRLGVYTLTLKTTIDAYVDSAAINFQVIPIGRATLTLIDDVSSAVAITPDGLTIVGNYGISGWTRYGAYRLDTTTSEIEYIGGFEAAVDVSDNGEVVLGEMPHPETGLGMAAIWNSVTYEWQSLGLLAPPEACGTNLTSAYGLSGDGTTAVGLAWSDQLGKPCDAFAFRWTAETGMEELPRLGDADQARANAVDYAGQVIAGFENAGEGGGHRRAVRWTADDPQSASDYQDELLGSLYPLDPVNGPGEALAVSRNGVWIGGEASGIQPDVGAFLWSEQTGLIPIPNGHSYWNVYPTAISDDGRTVLCITGPAGGFYREGCIWTAEAGFQSLASWMTLLGADLSALGGRLEFPMDMTADCKTIVGHNTTSNRAWIARLPSAQTNTPPTVQTPIEQPIPGPTVPPAPSAAKFGLSLLK